MMSFPGEEWSEKERWATKGRKGGWQGGRSTLGRAFRDRTRDHREKQEKKKKNEKIQNKRQNHTSLGGGPGGEVLLVHGLQECGIILRRWGGGRRAVSSEKRWRQKGKKVCGYLEHVNHAVLEGLLREGGLFRLRGPGSRFFQVKRGE